MEDNKNSFSDAPVIDGSPVKEQDDRELLIFGEGTDGTDKGVRYTKPKPIYFILAGLIGIVIGVIIALCVVSSKLGGLKNMDLINGLAKYDTSVITELLTYIEDVHFGETPTAEELITSASHALVEGMGDPYAEYYTLKEYQAYSSSFNGSYYGIGILVQNPDGTGALIRRVYEGSYAESAGLMRGDIIIAVDGESTADISGADLVSRITGDAGTMVSVTFLRDGVERTVSVMRGEVYVKRVETLDLDDGLGYIYLSSFSGNAVSEFRAALESFEQKGVEKLIIDLRDNPGGSLSIVIDICDMLLPECTICSMQGKTTNPTKYFYSDKDMYDFDFVVLVNDYSASASEIFAGAMQDNNRAEIIGIQTYGKGVVQTTFPLDGDHGYLKLTTDAYYTPNGTNLGGTGITPDMVVELPEELLYYDIFTLYMEHLSEDTQIQAGIRMLSER